MPPCPKLRVRCTLERWASRAVLAALTYSSQLMGSLPLRVSSLSTPQTTKSICRENYVSLLKSIGLTDAHMNRLRFCGPP